MINNVAIFGSSGALGAAFTRQLSVMYPQAKIHAFSRSAINSRTANLFIHMIDYESEDSIHAAAELASSQGPLDLVIVATGILHEGEMMPEKSIREISAHNLHRLFDVNTIIPALIAKHFLPKLNKNSQSIFAALSARVGSISDNQLGGWYAYRASKAALNMIIKTAAIEMKRSNKNAVVLGLHPGTVDSSLSKPFQNNVPTDKLFTPDFAVEHLISVLTKVTSDDSGKCFDWNGVEIQP